MDNEEFGTGSTFVISVIGIGVLSAYMKLGNWTEVFLGIGYILFALFLGAIVAWIIWLWTKLVGYMWSQGTSTLSWFRAVDEKLSKIEEHMADSSRREGLVQSRLSSLDQNLSKLSEDIQAVEAFAKSQKSLDVDHAAREVIEA